MAESLKKLKELFDLKDADLRNLFAADAGLYRGWRL